MTQKADKLIQQATDLLRARYCKEGHHAVVAAAVLTQSGNTYVSTNLGTYQPSISTCAEIMAIGLAFQAEPDMKIDTIVTVRDKDPYLITPCGKCREYIADYGDENTRVVIPDDRGGYTLKKIGTLLPDKYKKRS